MADRKPLPCPKCGGKPVQWYQLVDPPIPTRVVCFLCGFEAGSPAEWDSAPRGTK